MVGCDRTVADEKKASDSIVIPSVALGSTVLVCQDINYRQSERVQSPAST